MLTGCAWSARPCCVCLSCCCCCIQLMKVVAYSFNGVQPIDSNNAFTSEVLAAAPGKKFIVVCEAGGTMRQTVNFPMVGS